MGQVPFFTRQGDVLIPTPASRGPWSESSLHARVVIGLLAREIERLHGETDLMPARLTVDLYRLPDLSPARVTTTAVREGGRIKVIDATFISGGLDVARATCQLLRRTRNPEGKTWSPPKWDAPPPDALPAPERGAGDMGAMWRTRPIEGGFGESGRRRLWMSEVRDLVEGEAPSPFVRVALAADFASPFANSSDKGLGWINSDVSLYLHRLPTMPWIGLEVVNHQASDGIAIGECWLHDEAGPIGSSTVAALAQRRIMGD